MTHNPDHDDDDRYDTIERKIEKDIREHGLSLIAVFGNVNESFTYSVGRAREGLPELYIRGVTSLGHLLNVVHAREAAGELDVLAAADARSRHAGLLEGGYGLAFKEIDPEAAEMNLAIRDRDGTPFRAVQVLWPDVENRLPGEDDYSGPDQEV